MLCAATPPPPPPPPSLRPPPPPISLCNDSDVGPYNRFDLH